MALLEVARFLEVAGRAFAATLLSALLRPEAQIAQRQILNVSNPHFHLVLGREFAVQKIRQRVAVRQVVIGLRGNRYIKFHRIDTAAEITGFLTFLQEAGDISQQTRIARLG